MADHTGAVPSHPADARARRSAAAALREQGRLAEAEAALRQAALAFPSDGAIHAEWGLTLSLLGRPAEAEPVYRRAVALEPRDVFALTNLAGTLQQLGRPTDAEALYRQALAHKPDHTPALRNLAVLLKNAGRVGEAKAAFLEASRHDQGLEPALQAYLALSPVVGSAEDLERQRADFARGLAAFEEDPRQFAYAGEKANLPWYYLAYHNSDDRPLLEAVSGLLRRKAPGLNLRRPLDRWRPPAAEGRRARVAFCSEFLFGHTIGRLYRGFIARLDRSRFEVLLLHGAHAPRDAFRAELDSLADQALTLAADPREAVRQIAALEPDVLFFPDIGMSAQTYFLAHARLAPVQAASWGHPNTTGVSTVDYFVSCDAIEPDDAEGLYSERLIRLARLPCYYQRPEPAPEAPRSALRLPETGALYGCPQTLFKFHPEFDRVLAEIAAGDPTGRIVLVDSGDASWTEVLKARWTRSHPILLERAVFLPRLSAQGFLALLSHMDVLLDPLHFGSGNTLYEAMSVGAPIVTWPGRFARGRIVAAAYAQMGLSDPPVAKTIEAYAGLALALGRDAERRRALHAEITAKADGGLFADERAVREFETFIIAALDAAGRGERLPAGWRPSTRNQSDEP